VLLRAITNFRVDQSFPHPTPAQALQDEWKKAVGRIPPEMSNLFLGGVKPLGIGSAYDLHKFVVVFEEISMVGIDEALNVFQDCSLTGSVS